MSRTLEVTVDIEEKGGKMIKYAYKANKLPGDIDPDGCKTEASRHRVTDPQPVIFVSYLYILSTCYWTSEWNILTLLYTCIYKFTFFNQ